MKGRQTRAAIGVAALLVAMVAPASAQEETPWRFSTLRPGEGPEDRLEAVAGGGDVTGDGIDDAVVQVIRRSGGEAEARVVSGAPQESWVSVPVRDGEPSGLVVVGPPDRNDRPVPVGCDPGIVGDVDGDGIDELVVASCPPPREAGPPRLWVVFGSPERGEVRLQFLGEGEGYEIDLGPLPGDASVGSVAVLERVDASGSRGVAVTVTSELEGFQVRVYRLTGTGGELWAVFEDASGVRSAGDFHGGGSTDVLLSRLSDRDPPPGQLRGQEVVVARLPTSPDPEPNPVDELGSDEVTRLGRFGGLVHYNGVGDVTGDGFDEVVLETQSTQSDSYGGLDRRWVVLGGPASGEERHREFDLVTETTLGNFEPPAPFGDLNGDRLDDFALSDGRGGFFVVYGSRTVETIDLDRGGPRSDRVAAPQPYDLSSAPAPVGGEPGGGPPRVALIRADEVMAFEPPGTSPRSGIAFDGDPGTRGSVRVDFDEVDDVDDPRRARAVARSVAVSRAAFAGSGARHAVVATVDGFADALAASPLLGAGPLLLTGPDELPEVVRDEVHRVLPGGGRVYVLGGQAAVSDEAIAGLRPECGEGELPSLCFEVQRVSGASRVETAAAVARLVGAAPGGQVAVARAYGTLDASGADVTGAGWADAVTAGGWAAATGTPVLLTPTEELHPAVADAVADLGAASTVVLGGTAAVSDEAAAGLPRVRRVAGRDRAETAVAVVEQLWPPGTARRILVDGYAEDGWTGGLPAAALAADGDAPLLLGQGDRLPSATVEALRACPPEQPADVVIVSGATPDAVLAAQRC